MQSRPVPDLMPVFPTAAWERVDLASLEPLPYPGFRPEGSWRLTADGRMRGLTPNGERWQDISTGDLVKIADRHLVLAYGSNPGPAEAAEQTSRRDGW